METLYRKRAIDPFFDHAVNQIFLKSDKTSFVMDGSIGLGKSSFFLMWGAYQIAQCVEPMQQGRDLVRQSLWAGIRESENSAQATFMQLLEGAIFSPELMASEDSPVLVYGSHPSYIEIRHDLPDGTILSMKIECHGFNNDKAFNRLKTREYMGALIPEMQAIPYNIYETAIERCGRWRTERLKVTKKINGKTHTLTGVNQLCMVLCDVNIPTRPHKMYEEYYDKANKSKLPSFYITPPAPLLKILTSKLPPEKLDQLVEQGYPVTRYEGKEYLWYPNKACYNMTRHFEEKDSHDNNIPWSGYKYWFNRLHRSDSEVRRYVEGLPDTVSGESAVYKTFKRDENTLVEKKLITNLPIYIGYDPGGHAALIACQLRPGNNLHVFKEYIFEPVDGTGVKQHFKDFLFPYARKNWKGFDVIIIPDPASTWLGKNQSVGHTESVIGIIQRQIKQEMQKHPESRVKYSFKPCYVANQATDVRVNSLGYFIDAGLFTIDPEECESGVNALSGGYQKKTLKSGVVSDNIDKEHPSSHVAEAIQYPAVNILMDIRRRKKNGSQDNKHTQRGAYRVRRAR